MTLVADPPAPVRPTPTWRKVWEAPLRAHVAALALLLLALVPVVGTGTSFSADEGAAIVQARSLARGDGWVVEHPLLAADPTGVAYPLELSERGPRGVAPFAKHPLYALLLAGADRLGGVSAMVALSLLGTVAAAGLAGLLAGRLNTGLDRLTVWTVGLATPLLFDGFLVIAHTLGAACAVGAVLGAVVALERRRPLIALGAVVPCVAAAVLLRSEAVFLAAGLAVAAAVVGRAPRDREVAVTAAAGALLAAVAARLGEGAWIRHLLGGTTTGTGAAVTPPQSGFLAGRVDAFRLTWLRPSYDASPAVDLLLALMVVAVLAAAFVARRRGKQETAGIGLFAGAAAACVVVAVALDPTNVVPGLLVACPLLVAGMVLARRDDVLSVPAVTAVVFAAGVLATQYSTGGSGEWGGRYFALALPLAVPVVLRAVRRQGARPLAVGLVVCSLALGVMAVGSLRSTHRFGHDLLQAVNAAAPPVAGEVMVTTVPSLPRLAWSTFDEQRWLLTTPARLDGLAAGLRASGVDRFTFVSRTDVDLPATVRQESATNYRGWRILVLRTS